MSSKRKARTAAGAPQQHAPVRLLGLTSRTGLQHLETVSGGLELIRDEDNPLQIHIWRGTAAAPETEGEPDGPGQLSPGLLRIAQVLSLPTKPVAFQSVGKLFGQIQDAIQTYAGPPEAVSELLAYFVIASWFPDVLPFAPCIIITGSAMGAQPLLQVLRCLCRRGFLAADLTPPSFCRAVQLMPTLIMGHSDVNSRLGRLMIASSCPGYVALGRDGPWRIFAPKVILANGDQLPEELMFSALRIAIPPLAQHTHLHQELLQKLELEFQNKLFGYRLAMKDEIGSSTFDVPSFGAEMRPTARTLGSCTIGDPKLQGKIIDLLRAQDTENRISHGSDFRCVVIEAVLFHAREAKKIKFHVGEITQTVNRLLQCRNEAALITERRVGAQLKSLGFRKRRDRAGIYLVIDAETNKLVERLAREYEVLSIYVDGAVGANRMESVPHASQVDSVRRCGDDLP